MPTVEHQSEIEISAFTDSGYLESIDMTALLMEAYDLGDSINHSAEVADYLYWKAVVDQDADVQAVVKQFAKAREQFADCERFGRFHPDFHAAKDRVAAVQAQLESFDCVRKFKAAEHEVDTMLYEVSRIIADAVSESVKVPSNDPNPKGSGCGSGGSCGCGSGGCG
ncbi:protein of unknown function DUF1333 [Paenibacillus curdlanolyticus YK9]|uniref:Regulatory protein YlbF n=1 Tax=Paenibacillus curdlanolyticus YK9 TaxID=717606 RepID=E0I3S0_9BACL|nr:YlbF family regulator [Paenibacillus curdlanolyticus]EFM12934.1 protein of unknown function DUF1333 [Paenibacillus curdlanolyticus YK9]